MCFHSTQSFIITKTVEKGPKTTSHNPFIFENLYFLFLLLLIFVGLGIDKSEMPQSTEFSVMEDRFAKEFLTKTREEWNEVFKDLDACYAPILEFHEAEEHEHNKEIGTFIKAADGHVEPAPAPRLSRTPGVGEVLDQPDVGQNTREELIKLGYTESEIDKMIADDILYQFEDVKAKL